MTRTIVKRGVTWRVTDTGPGREEWVRVAGSGAHEFRVAGAGSCTVVGGNRPAASRSRPAPAASRARSTAKPITRAVLSAQARQAIVDELLRFDDSEHESRETGGHLVGRLDGSTLVVNYAHGAGPGAIHDFGRLSLDLGYTRSVENACADGEVVCGLWHSHFGRPDPSRQDLAHWAGEARFFRGRSFTTPLYLGLIATRAGADWRYPKFHAWLSRGDEHRADPIELEEERWRL
jgi:JAB domain-containing protein similar to deubiquitination enzymes